LFNLFRDIGRIADELNAQALELSAKLRVEVKVPDAPPDASWFIVCGEDVLETAEAGEVLRVLVNPGFRRIHAVRKGRPDQAVLLFNGDVQRDVALPSSAVRIQ
jgi:hypothetical protein